MAFQHGRLLKEEISRGVLMELNRVIPNLIHNSVTKNALLGKVLARALDYLGNNVLLNNIAKDDLKDTFALSEGAGLPLETISGALLSIEALNILAKYATHSRGLHVHPMAFSGCSSFAAWGKYSATDDLVIGRNLDYQLNGFFDANPLVAYHEPTDGQKYVSIGSAGLHTPSLTAFNESGIYLAVHMAPTMETSFSGTPVYFISSEVIRRARTFQEAVDIFSRTHPTAGWSFLLASVHEKRVASIELTYDHMRIRESDLGFMAQTNHFLSPEMANANLHINRSIDLDSMARLGRMEVLAKEKKVDAKRAVEILSDTYDPYEKRTRALGSTLAVHITVGSAVFCPGENRFFVGNGMAPVCQNDFVEFPWIGRENESEFARISYEKIPGGKFRSHHPEMAEALERYIEAKVLYENYSKVDEAYLKVQEAVRLDPSNAAYLFVLGIFACKQELWDKARDSFSQVLGMDHTERLHHLSAYYRGRIYAHEANKPAAFADYDHLLSCSGLDEKLKRAARMAKNRLRFFGSHPFAPHNLPLMMQFADLLSY